MKIRQLLFVLPLVFLLSSCATIFGGKKNTIKIDGIPDKSEVYLDGNKIGETPLKLRVSKYLIQEGSIIEVRSPGYKTLVYEVVRRPHVGYVLLNIVTGSIPLIVDVANGNIYRPNTRNIEYDLLPVKKAMKQEKTQKTNSKN